MRRTRRREAAKEEDKRVPAFLRAFAPSRAPVFIRKYRTRLIADADAGEED